MSAVHLNRRDLENHDAVAMVIKDGLGRILTLYHAKFDFWTLPLGKAEPNQSVEQAAAAEAYEECGIEVREIRRVC
uniref:NUDIX domain-containing protein n=1 Tax=Acinetobacter baumannii TaxID=470 RepID=UPI0013D724D1